MASVSIEVLPAGVRASAEARRARYAQTLTEVEAEKPAIIAKLRKYKRDAEARKAKGAE